MSENNFVSRVYFPNDCTESKDGWLIGWNISNFISCVATVVEETEEQGNVERLKDAMRSMSKDPALQDMWSYCSCPPTVLGKWSTNLMSNTDHTDAMFWLEMYPERSRPALRAVFCVGSRYHTTSKIILYVVEIINHSCHESHHKNLTGYTGTIELKMMNFLAERRAHCEEDFLNLLGIS